MITVCAGTNGKVREELPVTTLYENFSVPNPM